MIDAVNFALEDRVSDPTLYCRLLTGAVLDRLHGVRACDG